MIGFDQWRLANPAISPYNPFTIASNMLHPSFLSLLALFLFFIWEEPFSKHS